MLLGSCVPLALFPLRRGLSLHRRFDVLVVAEQIRWIVLLLQPRQTLVVGAIGRPDLVCTLVSLLTDVVDIDPSSGVRPQYLPQLSGPVDVALRLPRVQPLGDEEQ